MSINTRIRFTLALMLAHSAYGHAAAPTAADESSRPEVIRNLEQKGVEIMGEFQAPGGLRGFAGVSGGAPVTLYVTPDGAHAIAGTLLNAKGEDVSESEVDRLVVQPMSQRVWAQLERSHWVVDGDARAKRVVYAFTDPNCPYCHRFWEASRRWIESGKSR